MTRTVRTIALCVALGGCAAAVAAHVLVLRSSGQNPVTDPIGLLSTAEAGPWHGGGILAFALAHLALAVLLGEVRTGVLRQIGRVALVLAAGALAYIALWFALADPGAFAGEGTDDRLPVPASLVGAAMGLLLPGLWRTDRPAAVFDGVCFGVWLALTALVLLVDRSWIGAYERLVGSTYVLWVAGMAVFAARAGTRTGVRADEPERRTPAPVGVGSMDTDY